MISTTELNKTIETMILSASGWRGIFTADGGEENAAPAIAPVYEGIAAAVAAVFADYLAALSAEEGARPLVIVGEDTRPTGKTIAGIMIRAFLRRGCDVRYAGICAAPEIMAYTRETLGGVSGGFCYISASHNPIGHNGFKFGLTDGGVLEGAEANKLIASFKAFIAEGGAAEFAMALKTQNDDDKLRRVYAESAAVKENARAAYFSFSELVISGGGSAAEKLRAAMIEGIRRFPLGIAADFNGSARTISIDEHIFSSLGLGFQSVNNKPGDIAHAIIPEGDSLDSCRAFLEELHRRDPSVTLGYMPDCDGDRGNLVIWDGKAGKGRSLEAQEVFALACAAELAHLVWMGELAYDGEGRCLTKAALAVNGPTSIRVERIAAAFGVPVFRAEVGEANVVNLARRLRAEGYVVRILGEGSNGGNITYPSSVRDPLATVFALVKLLTIRGGGALNMGLFAIWQTMARKAGIAKATPLGLSARQDFSLSDIIASLPSFVTTSASAPEAKLQVITKDHALLKSRYQKVFEKAWSEKKDELRTRWNITGREARACIGTEEFQNLASFGDAQSGGLKIVFKRGETDAAFIWMRGSKTEPVFRVIADAEDEALERVLIAWQREMTTAADRIDEEA